MTSQDLVDAKKYLAELRDDSSAPRNVKFKVDEIISLLEGEGDISINISKALNILEELCDDINIESYTRTQLWNVTSCLEKVA